MNSILLPYFNRIKSFARNNEVEYFEYEREKNSSMPFSIHFRFIDQNGITRNSWGSGKNKDEAFGKALMEMIERIYFSGFSSFEYRNLFGFFKKKETLPNLSKKFELPLLFLHPSNTNGVAIHLTKRKAIESAVFELIERHTILYSLLMGIGPSTKMDRVLTSTKKGRFYIWESPLKTFTVVGALTDSIGSYFSSGCDFDLNRAILKAELELNSFLFLENEAPKDFMIRKGDLQSINRYHKFSGDKGAIDFFESQQNGVIPDLDKKHFYFSEFPVPAMFKGLYPFPCFRVIHPDVQQLFFDNWDKKYLNPRLFSEDQVLPRFPHIIA